MKSIRINLTQPADLLAAIDAAAKQANLSRSEWLAMAAIAKLPKSTAKQLGDRPTTGRPKGQSA